MDRFDRQLAFGIAACCLFLLLSIWSSCEFSPAPPLTPGEIARSNRCTHTVKEALPFPGDLPFGIWCLPVKGGETFQLRPTHTLSVWPLGDFSVLVEVANVHGFVMEKQTIRRGSECIKRPNGYASVFITPKGSGQLYLNHRPTYLPINC